MSCVDAQSHIPPEKPPTLNVTLRIVAKLGGFLGRTGDGEPGPQTLWRGLQRLNDMGSIFKSKQPTDLVPQNPCLIYIYG